MKQRSLPLIALGAALWPLAPAYAAEGEASFTPTRFVMPIYSIMLARELTTNVPLYRCPASIGAAPPPAPGAPAPPPAPADAGAEDCMVDMADEAALASLFSAPAAIPPGTYDSIVVGTCEGSSAFVAKLEGSVVREGTTWYTTSGPDVVSTDPADLGSVSINYSGCGNTVKLEPPLTIEPGDSITVNAFFTLQNLAWVLGNLSPGLGGCAEAPAGSFSVCSGLPVLVGYIGAVAPTLEAFYITEDPSDLTASKAGGQVLLLSSNGEPFSGFLRRVYSHDSLSPSVSYDVPLREITKNSSTDADAGGSAADAAAPDAAATDAGAPVPTYDIFAIGDPAQDVTKYRVRYPRFELRDHTGSFYTANGASQVSYRAVRR
ncbi:MAG TPA: hypothetical protein VMG12_40340 [Polyangiaceae bacterium]|nr:hypothetical protein [Polyangiaceae bacterium]